MTTDAMVVFLSLLIATTSIAGLITAALFSLPNAYARLRRYRERGPERAYARGQMVLIVLPVVRLGIFVTLGILSVTMDDTLTRQVVLRYLIVVPIVLEAVQVILIPSIDHSIYSAIRERESRESE